jgi:cytochrome d ubiquinol oxidase subunit II
MSSMNPDTLQTVWFGLICILWTGYLVLEGFDFGAGTLLRAIGRTPAERNSILHTFGPVWDGNEVWLLTAGGATFAAFPEWYATMFSGFYLALFLLLVSLILRNVAIEFHYKDDNPVWKARWEWVIVGASAIPAVLLGVAWGNIARGIPMDAGHEFTGTFWTLLNPYALLGGVASLTLFLAHGSHFVALRTEGDLRERAGSFAATLSAVAAGVVAAFAAVTLFEQDGIVPVSAVFAVVAVAAAAGAAVRSRSRSEGWAFGLSALAVTATFAMLFAWLWPNALNASGGSTALSLRDAASSHYTLSVMTVVAVIFTPLVLAYQGWTYWVFRKRVDPAHFHPGDSTPLDTVAPKRAATTGRSA